MVICRSCGEPNEATARFCQACGEALLEEPQPPLEVRKTVTILFADVAGSTSLGEQLDPEPLRRVMTRYFEEMRTVLAHYGGTVEKFIGDAVMAVFGVPTVHEDDALRAVRAADQMLKRLEELNRELELEYGIRLEMRIGINMGEVIAGRASAGQTLVTGDAVNVAKRLEQAAPSGTILIGKSMYPLVKDAVKVGPLESFKVKGKVESVSPLRLDAVDRLAAGIARRFDRPLIDRRDELAALKVALGRAEMERSCRLFTLLGAAGIGKSRLMSEFVAWLRGRATVLTGRCLPYGEGITFWPLRDIVRALGGPAGVRSTLAGTADADLVAERVLAAVGASPDSARGEEAAWAFRKLFEVLAQQRPVVVVLEDIHWASATLLDLIEYLLGWTQAPVLLACLARPDLIDRRPGWLTLRPNVDALAVDRLSETDAETLLTQTLPGQLRRGEPGEGDVRRITEAAEGNPLFLEQMAAMLAESDGGEAAVAVPPSIQALLAERLDQLSDDERAVIERAAVVGREFWRDAVVHLSSPAARAAVGSHLMALVRKELIRPDVSELAREDGFRFQHILIRDAAYDALPMSVRAELHERFARWLEQKASDPEFEVEEITGYHLEQAYRFQVQLGRLDEASAALAVRAGQRLGDAGRRALARGDIPGAVNLLERAASLLPEASTERLHLLPALAEAARETGDLTRADEILREVMTAAAAAGDRGLEALAQIDREYLQEYTDPTTREERVLETVERAIQLFEELGNDQGLAKAWTLRAQACWDRCRYAEMEDILERALLHAERAGDKRGRSLILNFLIRAAHLGPLPVEEGLRRCEGIHAEARGDPALEAVTLAMIGALKAQIGSFGEARASCRNSRAIGEEFSLGAWLAALPLYSGPIELLAGEPEAAERELRAGYDALIEMGDLGRLSTEAAFLAQALHAQGRYEEAEYFTGVSEGSTTPDDVFSHIAWRGVRSKALARKGELEQAKLLAREAVALAEETDGLNLYGDALLDLGEVLRTAGRPAEAGAATERALSLYERKGNLVSAARARAALAAS